MTEKDVLRYIRLKKSISVSEFQKITFMGFAAAKKYLCGLVNDGVLASDDGLVFDYVELKGEPTTNAGERELERRSKILDKMYAEMHTINAYPEIYDDFDLEEAAADGTEEEVLSPDDEEDLDLDFDGLSEACSDEKRVLSADELAAVGSGITLDTVLSHLGEGFKIFEGYGECWISCGASFPDKSPFKLGVKGLGAGLLLTDLGSTLKFLSKGSLKGLDGEIESILQQYGVRRIGNELIIRIINVENVFCDFLSLYSASLRVAHLKK